MSSNIRIDSYCEYCSEPFIAKTTVTRFCSDVCAKKSYKERKRNEKIRLSMELIAQLNLKKQKEKLEFIQSKDFLTLEETRMLLSISRTTLYRLIKSDSLKPIILGKRKYIKKSHLNEIFNES